MSSSSSSPTASSSWKGTKFDLIRLLKQASRLEQTLLNAYLVAAFSLKSLPEETAVLPDGKSSSNLRNKIQLERLQRWQKSVLSVTHEEMLHLHYVQALLRGLGEPPDFSLPPVNAEGNWFIPNWTMLKEDSIDAAAKTGPSGGEEWKANVEGADGPNPDSKSFGTEIPIAPISLDAIQHFVQFESTDSIQVAPLEQLNILFNKLAAFELDLQFEQKLAIAESTEGDGFNREQTLDKLRRFYQQLPKEEKEPSGPARLALEVQPKKSPSLPQFPSIADFYYQHIIPGYKKAFEKGWVLNTGDEMVQETSNVVPHPIQRDNDFNNLNKMNTTLKIDSMQRVADIVREIVDEGEGASKFQQQAEKFLDYVKRIGGVKVYAALFKQYQETGVVPPGDIEFVPAYRLRTSHLYMFAVILSELQQEQGLFQLCGLVFDPARQVHLDVLFPELSNLSSYLPYQFNQIFLVLLTLLSRMYEIHEWVPDTERRLSIEQNGTYEYMFQAIRPSLILASCFSKVITGTPKLFQLDESSIPTCPAAQSLFQLYTSSFRNLKIIQDMDKCGSMILQDVAQWATVKLNQVQHLDLGKSTPEVKAVVGLAIKQLGLLSKLGDLANKIFSS